MSEEADSVAISIGEDVLHGDPVLPEEAEGVPMPPGERLLLGDSSLLEEAERVAMPLREGMLLGDSSLPEEAGRVTMPSGEGVLLGDPSQSQHQESIVNHGPHMSIDELLKVIKGANGMPVLFVPSSDGRLAAVAVDGLHNMMPTNHENNGFAERKQKDFRALLLLLTSLVATVTFTMELTPPRGFWSVDDKVNGYVAGTSIMRDKFHRRYLIFYCSNTTAFSSSLMIIAMLARNKNNTRVMLVKKHLFACLVGICFMSLEFTYISGTWTSQGAELYTGFLFGCLLTYMMMHVVYTIFPEIVLEKLKEFGL